MVPSLFVAKRDISPVQLAEPSAQAISVYLETRVIVKCRTTVLTDSMLCDTLEYASLQDTLSCDVMKAILPSSVLATLEVIDHGVGRLFPGSSPGGSL